MHRLAHLAAVFLIGAIQLPAGLAADLSAAQKAALPGHYYLQGATEVGSELLLKKDGSFQWMLAYGAVDQSAQGTWRVKGDKVVLSTGGPAKAPVIRLFRENEMNVRKAPADGTWVAIVGIPQVGPAPGMEVKFEARSGKSATAISDRNGDAIVKMPASEKWARSGVRRAGQGEWQWLDMPAERAKARIAGIAIDDLASVAPAPFKTMELQSTKTGLTVDEASGFRGTYVK
jgi:hypothetical protein